jgi:hypothetical protein
MSYKYDVFISYSHIDVEWAKRLDSNLRDRGLTTFLDQKRLLGGDEWDKALVNAVRNSRNLAILWSNEANKSAWVRRELGLFEAIIDDVAIVTPEIPALGQDTRNMIFVVLEGEPEAYGSKQFINNIKDANLYGAGANALAPGVWADVIQRVEEAIEDDDPSTPIPLATLTMTQDELWKIDPKEEPEFGPSLNDLLTQLNIGTISDLALHYGADRTDWRPFGSPLNIRQMLDNLKGEINPNIQPPQFRWEPIDKGFWTNYEVAKRERNKLISKTNLSLIVIDPISLYCDLVYQRLTLLSNCFYNDKSLIMVLSPQPLPSWTEAVRTLIERRGTPFFDPFFDPPVPIDRPYANCSVNIGNPSDLRRKIRAGLGYVRGPQPGTKPEYLLMGKV